MNEQPPANRSRGIIWGVAIGVVGTLLLIVILGLAFGVGITPQSADVGTQATEQPADELDKKLLDLRQSWMNAPPPQQSPPAAVPQATSEYPKEVPIKSIDRRIASSLGAERGKTVAVQLAPGVYAERGSYADLETLDDYTSYAGLCADVKRYSQTHPGGYSCW
jgi:hypothetical protein